MLTCHGRQQILKLEAFQLARVMVIVQARTIDVMDTCLDILDLILSEKHFLCKLRSLYRIGGQSQIHNISKIPLTDG